MKLTVQVVVHADDQTEAVVGEVFTVHRESLTGDTLGLQLVEAKDLLATVQDALVAHQVSTALSAQVACPDCGVPRRHKDSRPIVMRTLFGMLSPDSPRWWHCPCSPRAPRTFSPLTAILPEPTTPELSYLQARLAGLVSYEISAALLGELFPLGRPLHATALRLQVQATAQRLEDELGDERSNQQVTFLTEGGEDIRDLPCYLNPDSEHLLDWFHITMRITVMTTMAKSLQPPPPDPDPELSAETAAKLIGGVSEDLGRLKWFLWHGNVFNALQTVEGIAIDLQTLHPDDQPSKLLKAVREFDGYLRANSGRLPNYGERRRAGEAISTAFTESAVNQVISMVKKQQMRWTPQGAHLLLQIRTRVLNNTLTDDYRRWYPGFTHTTDHQTLAA